MAVSRTITSQGNTSVSGKTIYAPVVGNIGSITNIRINNLAPAAYTISLFRYIAAQDSKVLLYTFNLDNGDVINDSTDYELKNGDYLFLTGSLNTVNYVVSGTEYPLQ